MRQHNELGYPFKRGFHPPAGEPYRVADGVYWLRMPMPMSLDHINLWLLKDFDGWVLVDSGLDSAMGRETWEMVFENHIAAEEINKIIVTHYHPDHIGLAAWLAARCNCRVSITEGEYRRYRYLIDRDHNTYQQQLKAFLQETGLRDEHKASYLKFFEPDNKPESERVRDSIRDVLREGDHFTIGGRDWTVICGNGHSPEHACLYCVELSILISGDQALPRISSNISIYASNKDDNPLKDWLDSCVKLQQRIPADTLVLPAHQEPFIGIDLRMQQLIDEHTAQLDKLRINLQQPTCADGARQILFDRELNTVETLLATSETLSHLNYLIHNQELDKQIASDNTARYCIRR